MSHVSRMPQVIRLGDDLAPKSRDDRIDRVAFAWQRLVESLGDGFRPVLGRDAHLAMPCVGEIVGDHGDERLAGFGVGVGFDCVEDRGPQETRRTGDRFCHAGGASGRSMRRIERVRSTERYAWILSIAIGSLMRNRISSRRASRDSSG